MSETSNRQVIDRYVRASVERDLDAQDELRHADYVSEYPQSGERIRGPQNARAILDNYPGGVPPAANVLVKGSEDQWVATPVGTLLRVIGTGDVYTALFTVVYPGDARPWHMMGSSSCVTARSRRKRSSRRAVRRANVARPMGRAHVTIA